MTVGLSVPPPGGVHVWLAEPALLPWPGPVMSPADVSALLQRTLLAGCLGTPPDQVRIIRRCPRHGLGDHGRPELGAGAQRSGVLDYSVSHTAGLFAMAVTARGRVGIDVESSHRRIGSPGAVLALLTPAERARLAELPDAAARARLLTLWTRKEAVGKVTGLGLTAAMGRVDVTAPGRVPTPDGASAWLTTLPLPAPYVGALATTDPASSAVVRSAVPWLRHHWPVTTGVVRPAVRSEPSDCHRPPPGGPPARPS